MRDLAPRSSVSTYTPRAPRPSPSCVARWGYASAAWKAAPAPAPASSSPPDTPHDWWNAGDDTAWIIVEVDPGGRFETMIRNLFGLAADGRTDTTGRPGLLQAALLAREFDDTIRFTTPPRAIQRSLFALLAPLARLHGLRGSYPQYEHHTGESVSELEEPPPQIATLLTEL